MSLAKRLNEIMKEKGWDVAHLAENSRLNVNECYKIMRGVNTTPSIELILSISLGGELLSVEREELLKLAGHSWQNASVVQLAYQYIIDKIPHCTVTEFNSAYIELKIVPLNTAPLRDILV
ncbi:hypothetical protein FACS1894219_03010 [Clostridia bacterium]|nr:hypothetical protein FACS1894219_03010 [Clostridia bacterium]